MDSLSSPLLHDHLLTDSLGNGIFMDVDIDNNRNDNAYMDAIEVFTFDHEILERITKSFYSYLIVIWYASSVLVFICLLVIAPFLFWVLIAPYLALILLLYYSTVPSQVQSERYRRECARFVVARQCLYVDEVKAPGSKALQHRIIHRIDNIQSCSVKRIELFGHIIFQVIVRNCQGNVILRVNGLRDAQKFVATLSGLLDVKIPRRDTSTSNIFVV